MFAQKVRKCEASTKYEKCIPKTKRAKKREGRKRREEQGQQRERREQKNKAGPYTLPNSRSPASGGNYWYNSELSRREGGRRKKYQ